MTDAKEQLEEWLRFYQELGVEAFSLRRATGIREPVVGVPPSDEGREKGRESRVPIAEFRMVGAGSRDLFAPVPAQAETLEQVREDLGDCRRCKLWPTRKTIVYGTGNPRARLMFVGEAPGAEEDEQGLPFVGRAGRLLDRIIEAMGLTRQEVYITNILKCRPPDNRPPEPDEIASCEPFLFRQIEAIHPAVICALGTFGAQVLLQTKTSISKLRGRVIEYRDAKLVATYHPAFLLRNPRMKRETWEDIQLVMKLLGLHVR